MNNFFINELHRRSRIMIRIMVACAVIFPLIFFIGTLIDTESYGEALLGKDRYNERMYDSYIGSLALFGCLTLIVTPAILLVKQYTDTYQQFIKTLSQKDMEKLIENNDNAPFYEKFMPPYIVKEDTVSFFAYFSQTTIAFKDIITIHVKHSYYKGYNASVYIQTVEKKYHFRLNGNVFKVKALVNEAVQSNPRIIVNKNWRES